MATKKDVQQFVLLPVRGLRAEGRTATLEGRAFLQHADTAMKLGRTQINNAKAFAASIQVTAPNNPDVKMRVLDSIGETGAKLIELSPKEMAALRENQPGLKIVPVVYYRQQVHRQRIIVPPKTITTKSAAKTAAKIRLSVVSQADNKPIANALVVAFTDFANRVGTQGTTNSSGFVDLALGALSKKLDRLYIYPQKGFWGGVKKQITISSGTSIKLRPIDLSFTDGLRHFYGNSPDNAGTGVKVAVVDSGVDVNHPDLKVIGGENTVQGENASDFGDNGGEGHGSHVAGIIAGRGRPPQGVRGLAPAVELFSFRVFGQNSDKASNFAIAKAIDRAVQSGCDLINMSLGGGDPDDATRAAMEDAWAQGSLVIVASGNDDRSPVSFPASFSPPAIAVSAMGRKGTFPAGTTSSDAVASPFGKPDKQNFIASFSNIGPEIDLTCTGVGIISTVPGGYAVMDGTSMATPAVTGFAAKLLAEQTNILSMPRGPERANAMAQALLKKAAALGFGAKFEGQGFPK